MLSCSLQITRCLNSAKVNQISEFHVCKSTTSGKLSWIHTRRNDNNTAVSQCLNIKLLYQDILVTELKISDFVLESDHTRNEKFWRCKIAPNILVSNRINLPEITLTLKLISETTCKLFLLKWEFKLATYLRNVF